MEETNAVMDLMRRIVPVSDRIVRKYLTLIMIVFFIELKTLSLFHTDIPVLELGLKHN